MDTHISILINFPLTSGIHLSEQADTSLYGILWNHQV